MIYFELILLEEKKNRTKHRYIFYYVIYFLIINKEFANLLETFNEAVWVLPLTISISESFEKAH